ncbi:DNA N-6-adenine-methyltransferase [Bacillus paranthracis]
MFISANKTDLWATPQYFFDELHKEFDFELDVCALEDNAKCEKYFTPEMDGLKQEWNGTCWMNPPYGRGIGKWVKKAYESSLTGSTVVCLLPARTDTRWWHDYCMKGEIRLVKGRLKFGESKNNAPFPNAVVIFGGRAKKHTLIAM